MLAAHSSATNEHYTPKLIVEAARQTLVHIDLDPATTASVNQRSVFATRYFTKEDDGLSQHWHGKVFLNPPGGRVGNRSSAAVWWRKLVDEYLVERVPAAIFLGFSIEILAASQDAEIWPGHVPFCVPRKRIQFLNEELVPGGSPTHSNIIVCLPDSDACIDRFVAAFSPIGKVST